MKPNRLLKAAAIALPMAFGTLGSAQAGTLYTDWTYDVKAWFTSWTPGTVTATNTDGTHDSPNVLATPNAQTYDRLSWGVSTGFGQSSLTIIDPALGSAIQTNGATVNGAQIIHNNFPITGDSLATADIYSSLDLFSQLPSTGQEQHVNRSFNLRFIETPNNGNGAGVCADGTLVSNNPGGCPDILVLLNPDALVQNFIIDGYSYTLNLFGIGGNESLGGLGPLSNAACLAAGAGVGCIGWRTAESAINTLQIKFNLTAVPAPEPESLALLGLGLLSCGWMVRRRKTA